MSNRLTGLKALLKPISTDTYARVIEGCRHNSAEVVDATADDIKRADEQRLGKKSLPASKLKLKKL